MKYGDKAESLSPSKREKKIEQTNLKMMLNKSDCSLNLQTLPTAPAYSQQASPRTMRSSATGRGGGV